MVSGDYTAAVEQLTQPLLEQIKTAVTSVDVKAKQSVPGQEKFIGIVAQLMAYAEGARDQLQRLVKMVANAADTIEQQLLHAVTNARKKVQALRKNAKRSRRKSKDGQDTKEIQTLRTVILVGSDDANALLGQIQADWNEGQDILDATATMLGGKLPCLDPKTGKAVKAHLGKFKGEMQAVLGGVKEQAMEALHEMTNEVVESMVEAAGEAMDATKEVGGHNLLGALGAGLNNMVQTRAAQKAKWCALPCV